MTRTPEDDRRIAIHESGHCLISRVFDMPIGGATIEGGPDFAGKVWGPKGERLSALGNEGQELLVEARPYLPTIGQSRDDAEPLFVLAQTRCIELLGGNAAEAVLHPDEPLLNANNDWTQARSYARIVCCSPATIDEFLTYCNAEAMSLLQQYRGVLVALADALIERRTLDGAAIDTVIAQSLAAHDHQVEQARRADMLALVASAKQFAEIIG